MSPTYLSKLTELPDKIKVQVSGQFTRLSIKSQIHRLDSDGNGIRGNRLIDHELV
jgi:hypothetical protein